MAIGRRVVRTTTTVKTEIIREHRCLGCGQIFSYPLTVGAAHTSKHGPNQLAAMQQLSKNIDTTVAQVPCPNCRMLQPEMVQQLRSEHREDGIGALILFLLIFGGPMVFFGFWPRVLGILLLIGSLWAWENLKQMNLNPNEKVSRKCRLRKRPGAEGMTPLKRWATGLTVLGAVAGLALMAVTWMHPEKVETENLEVSPAWVHPGDEVVITMKPHRYFEVFRQTYDQEVDCRYQVSGETVSLAAVGGRWRYNRSFENWKPRPLQSEVDWKRWIGSSPSLRPEDIDQILAGIVLQVPEDCPADPDAKLSVSWVLSYPWADQGDHTIHKREKMEAETIDLPLRPQSLATRDALFAIAKPTLGLVGLLALIAGTLLVPPAGNIKGFAGSILSPGDQKYGTGTPVAVGELLHS